MDYRNYDRGYAEPTMSASDYMTRTYRWMACGLLITFAMAYLTATTSLIYLVDSLYLVLTIAELALVFVLSSRVQTMSVGAARACLALWGRPRVRSWVSRADCTPKEMRFTPAARKPRRLSSVTVSGFASKVISAPGTGSAARMSRSACAGVSRLGVPPPK